MHTEKEKLAAVLFLRSYDSNKRISCGIPSAHDATTWEQIKLGFMLAIPKFGVFVFRRLLSHASGGSLVHREFGESP